MESVCQRGGKRYKGAAQGRKRKGYRRDAEERRRRGECGQDAEIEERFLAPKTPLGMTVFLGAI